MSCHKVISSLHLPNAPKLLVELYCADVMVQLLPIVMGEAKHIVPVESLETQLHLSQFSILSALIQTTPKPLPHAPSFGLGVDVMVYKLNRVVEEMSCPRMICARQSTEDGFRLWPLAMYPSPHDSSYLARANEGIQRLCKAKVITFKHGRYMFLPSPDLRLHQDGVQPESKIMSSHEPAKAVPQHSSLAFANQSEFLQILDQVANVTHDADYPAQEYYNFLSSVQTVFPEAYLTKHGIMVDNREHPLPHLFRNQIIGHLEGHFSKVGVVKSFMADRQRLFLPICRIFSSLEPHQREKCLGESFGMMLSFLGKSIESSDQLSSTYARELWNTFLLGMQSPGVFLEYDMAFILGHFISIDVDYITSLSTPQLSFILANSTSSSKSRLVTDILQSMSEAKLHDFVCKHEKILPTLFAISPLSWVTSLVKHKSCHPWLNKLSPSMLLDCELSTAKNALDSVPDLSSCREFKEQLEKLVIKITTSQETATPPSVHRGKSSKTKTSFDDALAYFKQLRSTFDGQLDGREFNKKLRQYFQVLFSSPDAVACVDDPERFPDFLFACHLAVYQKNTLLLGFFLKNLDDTQRQRIVDPHEVFLGKYSLFDTACRACNKEAIIAFAPYVDFNAQLEYRDPKRTVSTPGNSVIHFISELSNMSSADLEQFLTRFLNSGGDRLGPILSKILFVAIEKSVHQNLIKKLISAGTDIGQGIMIGHTIPLTPALAQQYNLSDPNATICTEVTCADLMASRGKDYDGYLTQFRQKEYPFLDPSFLQYESIKTGSMKIPFWQFQSHKAYHIFREPQKLKISLNMLRATSGIWLGKPFEGTLQEFRFFISPSIGDIRSTYTEYYTTSSRGTYSIPRILVDNMRYDILLYLIRFNGLNPNFLMTSEYLNTDPDSRLYRGFFIDWKTNPESANKIIMFLTTLLEEYPHIFVTPLFLRFLHTATTIYHCGFMDDSQLNPILTIFRNVVDILPKYKVSEEEVAHFRVLLDKKSDQKKIEKTIIDLSQHYPVIPPPVKK